MAKIFFLSNSIHLSDVQDKNSISIHCISFCSDPFSRCTGSYVVCIL